MIMRQPALRPLLVTFGSIIEPDGGLQVRSRILAESLASLGMPPTILSTREADPSARHRPGRARFTFRAEGPGEASRWSGRD